MTIQELLDAKIERDAKKDADGIVNGAFLLNYKTEADIIFFLKDQCDRDFKAGANSLKGMILELVNELEISIRYDEDSGTNKLEDWEPEFQRYKSMKEALQKLRKELGDDMPAL